MALDVCLMENHDQAFYVWRDAGVKQRVLVHIDAHHDMWWIQDQTAISIANFICPALRQDLVREMFWVVPDATFENARTREPILRHLKKLLKTYPTASRSVIEEEHRITASVLGKTLTVCPLRELPDLRENVLLDIDVDYLVIPRVSYGGADRHSPLPWRWPADLLAQLRGISSDLVTVVYSVTGGYTPLQWKFLGDELVLRLKKSDGGSELQGMDRMREAAEAELRGQTVLAESQYRLAMNLLPASAAPPYRLARLLSTAGKQEDGRRLYRQAVQLDGSYQGAYSSAGFHCFERREFAAAEREFRDTRELNPQDPHACLGLGLLAKRRKQWSEAEQYLRAALAGDDRLVDGHRAIGDVLVKQGKPQEALAAYEKTLKLGLMGHRPLGGPIVSQAKAHQILDPWHSYTHTRLAILYERTGATAKAINALRIGMAGGLGTFTRHIHLARLYVRQHQWRKSATEASQAVRSAPRDIRRVFWRLRRQLEKKIEWRNH